MANNVSLGQQELTCVGVARKNGLTVSNTFKDTHTAYKSISPMLKYILQNTRNSTIVFYDVSRFSRRVSIGMDMAQYTQSRGNELVFVNNKFIYRNPEKDDAKLIKCLEETEEESRKIGQRVRDAIQYKKSLGYYTGGYVPYGYETYVVSEDETSITGKKMKENKLEQKIMQFIGYCKRQLIYASNLNTFMNEIYKMDSTLPNKIGQPIACYDTNGDDLKCINVPLTNDEIALLFFV